MRTWKLTIILVLMICASLFPQTATAPSLGDGSSGDPYQIATLNNLYWVTQNSSTWGSYFIQTADIDASSTTSWDDGKGFIPIGNYYNNFTGSYNGQGHTISGLYINRSYGSTYTGLFGLTYYATINCLGVANVNITITNNTHIGGLVGWNTCSTITNCYSTGSVSGMFYVGGIVGSNTSSTISNCYSACSVNGNQYVGGLVGDNGGSTITNCYSVGSVSGAVYVGGLIGDHSASVSNSFWDTQTSGQSSSAGGTGKTTLEMLNQSTFTGAGWDFTSIWVSSGTYYPTLRSTPGSFIPILIPVATTPSVGDGSSGNPYHIATLDNLYWVSQNSSEWNKHYLQTSDINASETSFWIGGAGFSPIGNETVNFTGSYNGNGKKIDSLYIKKTSDIVGFFGYAYYAEIDGIKLTQVSISGYSATGGLIGINIHSTVTNTSISGTVNGYRDTGGLIGFNNYSVINTSYSKAIVNGGDYVGGLIGENGYSLVNNCYSMCSVNGSVAVVGGFVGYNYSSTITNSYSTGPETGLYGFVGGFCGYNPDGSIVGSFWDKETSGNISSSGGVGKTTAEMKTQSTFTDAGWDFGTVWEMIGYNYPRLRSNPDASLPVELSSFSTRCEGQTVILEWITESEVDNLGFILERSVGADPDPPGAMGTDWQTIASYKTHNALKGQGNTSRHTEYSFTDMNVELGKEYAYRLSDVSTTGEITVYASLSIKLENLPEMTAMENAYPNPFNPQTYIAYRLSENIDVKIMVFNMLGRSVKCLFDGHQSAGYYHVYWSGTAESGAKVPSGNYIIRMQTVNMIQVQKVMLVK